MKAEIASVAQLKASLSSYLAKANSGTTIEVTSHRKVIARVIGVKSTQPGRLPPGLAKMVAEGRLTPGNGVPLAPGLQPRVRLSDDGTTLSEMVLQDRGPR